MSIHKDVNGESLHVLYLVYWGALEPLGQSLVIPAVKRLSRLGVRITLVTFDKPDDLAKQEAVRDLEGDLRSHEIEWIRLRYHKRPKAVAKILDLSHGFFRSLIRGLNRRIHVVHARTYVGGLIGLPLSRILGSRFIYHNEGFYPDEQVDGGIWKQNSLPHRVAKRLEQQLYNSADGIIAMSYRGKEVIDRMRRVRQKGTSTIVVPSCVDFDLFRSDQKMPRSGPEEIRLVYIGSVGARYLFDRIARFAAIAQCEFPNVRLRVLSRFDPIYLRNTLLHAGMKDSTFSIDSVPHKRMPEELRQQDAGLFFLTQGISEHGCSPTKIGEYWACGLPVITTPNVSDTDRIIQRDRVGVVIREHSDDAYREAARELVELLKDRTIATRCRTAALGHYALDSACERQLGLYREITGKRIGIAKLSAFIVNP